MKSALKSLKRKKTVLNFPLLAELIEEDKGNTRKAKGTVVLFKDETCGMVVVASANYPVGDMAECWIPVSRTDTWRILDAGEVVQLEQ